VRTSSIVISIAAVVMGALAALLAVTWLRGQTREAVAPVGTIVVASTQLGLGKQLSEANVVEVPWATAKLPDGAFATKHDLFKDGRRVVLTTLERNEAVLKSKITSPGQAGTLSSLLEEGKRAVTVRVDDVRGVAGFIRPNDRVDVVLIRGEGGAAGGSYSDLILQGVKVLAVDQVTGERTEQAAVAKVVTLEVSPEDAQKIVLATNIGKLSLILRQAGAENSDASKRVTEGDLGLADPDKGKPAKAAAASPPGVLQQIIAPRRTDTATVAIVRALKREEYSVMQEGGERPRP
jgi:pilus assembly protein CpaB